MGFEDLKLSDLQKSFSDCSPADVHQLIKEFFDLKLLWKTEKNKKTASSPPRFGDDLADCMNLMVSTANVTARAKRPRHAPRRLRSALHATKEGLGSY